MNQFNTLPGVGKKSALRLVLHLLKEDATAVNQFCESVLRLKNEVLYCEKCFNISDVTVCDLCTSPRRDAKTLCVVEDTRDVMAIENTQQFFGRYHVLGGLISPMDGIGPQDLTIDALVQRIVQEEIKELIMALSATMEGDTTLFYLYKKIQNTGVQISTIARGIAFGGEIEYVDEVTLGRSILTRQPYEGLSK